MLTPELIAKEVSYELSRGYDTMAGNLRAACNYLLGEHPEMTPRQFADGAALAGVHTGTARNRYSETRRWMVEMGEL